jgi:hypothetical protein
MNKPKIYTSHEDTPEGRRYWAEVVVNAGELDERVLYSTAWFDNEAGARLDARAWVRWHVTGK